MNARGDDYDTDYLQQTGNRLAGIMREEGYGDYHRDKFDYNLEDRPDSKKMGFLSPKMTADYDYAQKEDQSPS